MGQFKNIASILSCLTLAALLQLPWCLASQTPRILSKELHSHLSANLHYCCFTHHSTVKQKAFFGHCFIDSINYPARKLYMGDAAPCDFKKWDTAPGLQLKRSTSLRSVTVRYSNNGLNIKAVCFFNIPAWSIICATQRRFLHSIIGPVQFLAVLEQS